MHFISNICTQKIFLKLLFWHVHLKVSECLEWLLIWFCLLNTSFHSLIEINDSTLASSGTLFEKHKGISWQPLGKSFFCNHKWLLCFSTRRDTNKTRSYLSFCSKSISLTTAVNEIERRDSSSTQKKVTN